MLDEPLRKLTEYERELIERLLENDFPGCQSCGVKSRTRLLKRLITKAAWILMLKQTKERSELSRSCGGVVSRF